MVWRIGCRCVVLTRLVIERIDVVPQSLIGRLWNRDGSGVLRLARDATIHHSRLAIRDLPHCMADGTHSFDRDLLWHPDTNGDDCSAFAI